MKLLRLMFSAILFLSTTVVFAQDRGTFTECLEDTSVDNYALWSVHLIEDCSPVQAHVDGTSVFLSHLSRQSSDQNTPAKIAVLQSVMTLTEQRLSQEQAVDTDVGEAFMNALRCDAHRLDQTYFPECAGKIRAGRALQIAKWGTRDAPGTVYRQTFLDPLRALSDECLFAAPEIESDCHQLMLKQFVPILELHNLVRQVIVPRINGDVMDAVVARYSQNHLRWTNYLADTGFQYPYELAFNRRMNGGFTEIAQGLAAPKGRWILLHPTAGIYHSDKLSDGNQTALMGIVKLIGGKRWTYGADNKPERVVGLSVTATFADIAGIDDLGYGVLAEYNSIALGVSRHGDENLVVFNVALNELFGSRTRSIEDWFSVLGF